MKTEIFATMAPVEAEGRRKEPMEKKIAFTFEAPADAKVQIAGDFNNWVPESLQLTESRGTPVWQKAFCLKPGSYQYKYLIDGLWMPDPANDKTTGDFFGGENSIINV